MQSPGYVLFIDASKAFDRVCHSHFFNILEERGVCPLIRRLLFKLYKNQRIRVRWNTCLSDISGISNGVKQGAVLSPILFTDYIDNLLARLRKLNSWQNKQTTILDYSRRIILHSNCIMCFERSYIVAL